MAATMTLTKADTGVAPSVEATLPQTVTSATFKNMEKRRKWYEFIEEQGYYVVVDDPFSGKQGEIDMEKLENDVYLMTPDFENMIDTIDKCDDFNVLADKEADIRVFISEQAPDEQWKYEVILQDVLADRTENLKENARHYAKNDSEFKEVLDAIRDYDNIEYTSKDLEAEGLGYIDTVHPSAQDAYVEVLDKAIHCRNQALLQKVHQIITTRRIDNYQAEKLGLGRNDNRYPADEPLTDEDKVIIDRIMSQVELTFQSLSYCDAPGCGCVSRTDFSDLISNGDIKMEAFKYLIEAGHISLDDKGKAWALKTFGDILGKSGYNNFCGMSDRIHERTMFMFEWLKTECPDDMIAWRDPEYNQCLMRCAINGSHDDRQRMYIQMLFDIGPEKWVFDRTTNGDIAYIVRHPEIASEMKRLDPTDPGNRAHSMIYWAARLGEPELVRMFVKQAVKMGTPLDYYVVDYVAGDPWMNDKTILRIMPIIPCLLQCAATNNDPTYLQEMADCIKILMENGVNPNEPIVYSTVKDLYETTTKKNADGQYDGMIYIPMDLDESTKLVSIIGQVINLQDILRLYKFEYVGSPIMEVFADLEIIGIYNAQKQLGVVDDDFPIHSDWFVDCGRDKKDYYSGKFYDVLYKHEMTKDPAELALIKVELDDLISEYKDKIEEIKTAYQNYKPVYDARVAIEKERGYDYFTSKELGRDWKTTTELKNADSEYCSLRDESSKLHTECATLMIELKKECIWDQHHMWKWTPHIQDAEAEYSALNDDFQMWKRENNPPEQIARQL